MESKAMLLIYMLMLGVARGSGDVQLRAGTLNALAVSKATVTVGGFPNYNMKGFKEHNAKAPYFEDNKIEYGTWLVKILDDVMIDKLDMLVLQEIDKPFYYSLLQWKKEQEKNEKARGATIKIYDGKGMKLPGAGPLEKGDGLYVILASKTWDMTCLPQAGKWTPAVTSTKGGKAGKVLACSLSHYGQDLASSVDLLALFMHGDSDWKASPSDLPKALPSRADLKETLLPEAEKNRDFDLIMGDWNVDKKENVESMVKGMADNKYNLAYKVLPNMYLDDYSGEIKQDASTLVRGEYEFRKIAQQYENACSLVKGKPTLFAQLCPSEGNDECTCKFFQEKIVDTTCKNKNDTQCEACDEYAKTREKASTMGEKASARFKKDCDTLKKICGRVDKCGKKKDEWAKFTAQFKQEENWCSTAYDWRGWTNTWAVAELTSERDAEHDIAACKVSYASGQRLHPKAGPPHFAVEDWIVIRETTTIHAEHTIVHEYAAIKKEADTEMDAPTEVWPSDHLLVHTTIKVGQVAKENHNRIIRETFKADKERVARLEKIKKFLKHKLPEKQWGIVSKSLDRGSTLNQAMKDAGIKLQERAELIRQAKEKSCLEIIQGWFKKAGKKSEGRVASRNAKSIGSFTKKIVSKIARRVLRGKPLTE